MRKASKVKMRKAIPMFAVIALALATAGVAMAHGSGDATSYRITTADESATSYTDLGNRPSFPGRWQCGNMHGPCRGGFGLEISVSDEFKENVINIAESDPDVQNLLNAGYENMHVEPIIKATVQGNGDVVIKATSAIVTLRKNGGRALVQVDLEAGKVTKIVITERTVIDKS
jgi:hypothetical protein